MAPSMKEALAKVKQEWGEEAVILKSKKVPSGGFLGFLGREMMEVTAAIDKDEVIPPPVARGVKGRSDSFPNASEEPLPLGGYNPRFLMEEIRSIKGMVEEIVQQLKYSYMLSLPRSLLLMFIDLVENGVEEKLARRLVQQLYLEADSAQLRDIRAVEEYLIQRIARMISTSDTFAVKGDGRPVVAALVGPSGVGKTTTLAKLAANNRFVERRDVALISVDTYRIAAIDQLRTFADIAYLPLEVVYTAEEIKKAIDKHRQRDLILIDTAGRNQRDPEHLAELRSFMQAAEPDEVHLVLSVTTKYEDLMDVVERFETVSVNRLIFTKLDETDSIGSILNVVDKVGKPVSYLTSGQGIPEDIEVADPIKLAKLITRERRRR